MQHRLVGWIAVGVVLSFLAQFAVGVAGPDDPSSRAFVLGTLNALAWYGLTALAAAWLLTGEPHRRRPALGIVAAQGLLATPGILAVLVGTYSSLPAWLVVSLVGDGALVAAAALAVWSLAQDAEADWQLWSWNLNRALVLGATALLALSERMPRFTTPESAPLVAREVSSFVSRIVTGPLPWRLAEIVSLVAVLAVGFAAATLRPRDLAVAVGAALAVPAVPELLSVVIDPANQAAAQGDPTGWLWAQTSAVVVLALALVFLATGEGGDGARAPLDVRA